MLSVAASWRALDRDLARGAYDILREYAGSNFFDG